MEEPLLIAGYATGYKFLAAALRTGTTKVERVHSPYRYDVTWWREDGAEPGCEEYSRAWREGLEPGWMSAACRQNHITFRGFQMKLPPFTGHAVDESCDCGFWAYHTMEDIIRNESPIRYLVHRDWPRINPHMAFSCPLLVGVIAFGEVETYENCFRAQYMRPACIYGYFPPDDRFLYRLAEDWGVPVVPPEDFEEFMKTMGGSLAGLSLYEEEEE